MPSHSSAERHYRACNLCEAMCGLEIELQDGDITAIRGDKQDAFSRGHICPKAVALQDIHRDPDRLRYPMRRTADGWQRLGWDEAFDLAASEIRRIQEQYGRNAMAAYLGNPNVHNYGSMLYGPPLLRALKTQNRYSATSVDQLPHHLCAYLLFGHQLLLPVPDIDRTDFLLIFGANPAVSNGSLMTAPDIKKRLKELRGRGGKVVLVDPRRTETARLADKHYFVRPGTDAFLLAALVHTVFDEGLGDPGRLRDVLRGLEDFEQAISVFSPEVVAPRVGMEAGDIRGLAREFCAAPTAVCYGRMGVSVQEFGGVCQWLIHGLNLVTGNFDRPGGALFTRPAVDLLGRGYGGGSVGRWHSRVRGLPEFAGELPVAALAEEMTTEGEGRIRGLVTSAGNPVLSTPNGRQLERGLEGLEFMVSIDFYINETTRHAHLILPPTAALEHDHYDLVFHALAIRNTTRYSQPLFEPGEDTRHDWQILHELRQRLDSRRTWRARFERWMMGRLGPSGLLNLALRTGPYGAGFKPWASGLRLENLKRQPHGIDLGPLEPSLPARLKTPDRKIHLMPELLTRDLERLEAKLTETGDRPRLVMISRRQVRSNNSWMHNYGRLMRGKDRCTLEMHPEDALAHGVDGAQRVTVTSRVGSVDVPLEVTEAVMPGVVCLPHGWGHHRPGTRLAVAEQSPGASINDLTDELRVDAACGNAALSGVPVTVEPCPG